MEGVRKSLVLGRPFVWGLVFTEGAWNLHDPFVTQPGPRILTCHTLSRRMSFDLCPATGDFGASEVISMPCWATTR